MVVHNYDDENKPNIPDDILFPFLLLLQHLSMAVWGWGCRLPFSISQDTL